MYTLEQLKNKNIVLFREPRSGSTWVMSLIIRALNREHQHTFIEDIVDLDPVLINSTNYVFSTHDFGHAFSILKYFKDTIIIRTSRRNLTEMLTSRILRRLMNEISNGEIVANIHNDVQMKLYVDKILPSIKPIVISEALIQEFIYKQKRYNVLWNICASEYENETIYYEDILTGWNSSILPLTFSVANDDGSNERFYGAQRSPIKIPYNKKELILNYDEIDKRLKDIFGDF